MQGPYKHTLDNIPVQEFLDNARNNDLWIY